MNLLQLGQAIKTGQAPGLGQGATDAARPGAPFSMPWMSPSGGSSGSGGADSPTAGAPFGAGPGSRDMVTAMREVGSALQSLVSPRSAEPAAPTHAAPVSIASSFAGQAPTQHYVAPPPTTEVVKTGQDRKSSGSGSGSGSGGGGANDFQIPDWFEAAAKRMMADRGSGDNSFGLPELTLIHAAASNSGTRLAASEAKASSQVAAPTAAPSKGGGGGGGGSKKEDMERLAREVYEHIMLLHEIDALRKGD